MERLADSVTACFCSERAGSEGSSSSLKLHLHITKTLR